MESYHNYLSEKLWWDKVVLNQILKTGQVDLIGLLVGTEICSEVEAELMRP